MNDDLHRLGLGFTSGALPHARIRLLGVTAKESLGQLYEVRAQLEASDGPLSRDDLDQLLLAPCEVKMDPADHTSFHGIVRELEMLESYDGVGAHYVATIVPRVWLLTVSRLCRVYQNMSCVEMAGNILARYGLSPKRDFTLHEGYSDVRPFAVQYDESEWDYIQRWLEHEGYFYWFSQEGDAECLVISDENGRAPPAPAHPTIPYRDRNALSATGYTVYNWRTVVRRIPARVVLKDYDYKNPGMSLVSPAPVDAKRGFGVQFSYGDHYDDLAAGKVLAKRRSERHLVEHETYEAETDCPTYHAGQTFDLWNHFSPEQNRRYLITEIEHKVGLDEKLRFDTPVDALVYRARFKAIPAATQFRPARTVAWPSIHGVMHGHIDSDQSGTMSTLDERGRYRVRLPWDGSGGKGEGASTWIRMAQSYAGAGYGNHFPLHKGTEVVVAFLDGDPDRPVIVGAIPNAHTPSPSASANASQSVIRTASGIRLVLDDMK